eukprot:4603577-Pyramimonas_sp.AAC.1
MIDRTVNRRECSLRARGQGGLQRLMLLAKQIWAAVVEHSINVGLSPTIPMSRARPAASVDASA